MVMMVIIRGGKGCQPPLFVCPTSPSPTSPRPPPSTLPPFSLSLTHLSHSLVATPPPFPDGVTSNPPSPYPQLLTIGDSELGPFEIKDDGPGGWELLLNPISPLLRSSAKPKGIDCHLSHPQPTLDGAYGGDTHTPTRIKISHANLVEFLGGSIPGSPASFLSANTSEAECGPSGLMFHSSRDAMATTTSATPPGLGEIMPEERVSDDDATGSVEPVRKKVRREAGHQLTEEEKRQRFLERNRRAAQRCRQKKKDMMERVQKKASELEYAYCQLVKEVEVIKVLNGYMMTLIGDHKGCQTFVQARATN